MLAFSPFGQSDLSSLLKVVWVTDLHLDAAKPDFYQALFKNIETLNPDLILVGGDTANGLKAFQYLLLMQELLQKEIYFVLGNHEFYHHSIFHTRSIATQTAAYNENLHYLTNENLVHLSDSTVLIGHDGWCDARAGNFLTSTVSLHDYHLIKDLKDLSKHKLQMKLHQLGTEAAESLEKKLDEAFKKYSYIVLLTHTPPFQAACIYDKHISDDNWAPHFVCKAMGDMLIKKMNQHPEKYLIALCGHAHHLADISILPNLRVIVGESVLGSPKVQALIQL
jgi:Icc-related predicted phosphoesterase